jgi:hypothetical protein
MRTDLFLEILKEGKKSNIGNVRMKDEATEKFSKRERQRRWILGLEGGSIE